MVWIMPLMITRATDEIIRGEWGVQTIGFIFWPIFVVLWSIQELQRFRRVAWLFADGKGIRVAGKWRARESASWKRIGRVLVYPIDDVVPPDGLRRWMIHAEREGRDIRDSIAELLTPAQMRLVVLATDETMESFKKSLRARMAAGWGVEPANGLVPSSLGERPQRELPTQGLATCIGCGYALVDSAPGLRCPECSVLAGHERIVVRCRMIGPAVQKFINGTLLFLTAITAIVGLLMIQFHLIAAVILLGMSAAMFLIQRQSMKGFLMQIATDSVVFSRNGVAPHAVESDIVVTFRPHSPTQRLVRLEGTGAHSLPLWVPREFYADMTAAEVEIAKLNLQARRESLVWRKTDGGARLTTPHIMVSEHAANGEEAEGP